MPSEVSSASEERAQIERLLVDPLFSQSKRYGSFLRYISERAVEHNQEPLTERALGIKIFGRPQNYDTDADPIVRVTASELRKRLAQYYEDPAHAGELRVLIHKGTYLAEFVPPGARTASVEVLPPQIPPAGPLPVKELSTRHRWRYVAGIAGVSALVAVVAWVARPQPSAFQLFWDPLLDGPKDILVSVPQFSDHVQLMGVGDPQLTWTDPLTPNPDPMGVTWSQYARLLVHMRDAAVAVRLSEFLGSKGKHVVMKGEHDLTMRDLRETPAVILGGLPNPWTLKLLPQARFIFDGEGTIRFVRDSQNPGDRKWKFDARVPSAEREKDFIIISRVADSASGRVTLLAGGFSAWGTEAALALLIDPDQMKTVLANTGADWNARNVQIVLESTVVNRQSGIPRVLAAHTW
jgi:hypothetical protein